MDQGWSDKIMEYIGGRPFLANLLFYHIRQSPELAERYFDARSCGGGIYTDYVNNYLKKIQEEEKLKQALCRIYQGKGCTDIAIAERFQSAGLIKLDTGHRWVSACTLYQDYFNDQI